VQKELEMGIPIFRMEISFEWEWMDRGLEILMREWKEMGIANISNIPESS